MVSLSQPEFGVVLALLPLVALVPAYLRTIQGHVRLSTHRTNRIWKLLQTGKLESLDDYGLQVALHPSHGWLEPQAIRWGLKDADPAACLNHLRIAKHLVHADEKTGKFVSTKRWGGISHAALGQMLQTAALAMVPGLGIVLQIFFNTGNWIAFGASCVVGAIYVLAIGWLGAAHGAADFLLNRPAFGPTSPPPMATEDDSPAAVTPKKRGRNSTKPTTNGDAP